MQNTGLLTTAVYIRTMIFYPCMGLPASSFLETATVCSLSSHTLL